MSIFQKTFEFFLAPQEFFLIPYYFNIFSLGTNKDNLLHVTHCIISSLLFYLNYIKVISTCHVMSLTYEHVLSN
jgi:hypothetical protein